MLALIVKVAGSLVLLFKEVVESQVSVGVSSGAVVNVRTIVTLGIPDFALATALAGSRAYLRSTSILNSLTDVGWVAIREVRNREVGDRAGRNGVFEGTKLLRRVISVRTCWEPFDGSVL